MTDTESSFGSLDMNDISTMISKLKENPEIIASVTSALGLPQSDKQPELSDEDTAALPNFITALSPLLTGSASKDNKKPSDDHCTALLCALRPYLTPQRQEVIDYILKLSKMGELLKKLK